MVGPVNRPLIPLASVPSRASFARRFLATLTVAPAWDILLRRSLTWFTVSPLLWATTITPVVLNTWLSVATSSFFSALSTCSLLNGASPWGGRAVGPAVQSSPTRGRRGPNSAHLPVPWLTVRRQVLRSKPTCEPRYMGSTYRFDTHLMLALRFKQGLKSHAGNLGQVIRVPKNPV